MPFPFGQYFGRCHILRRWKYSVKSDGGEGGGGGGGGGGRVLHNVLGLKAYTSLISVKQSVANMICES